MTEQPLQQILDKLDAIIERIDHLLERSVGRENE